ncbi:MAG: Gfo/Idh/MocA family oxidoreductase [bacterium]|nr:Gfo/Idh/MocA family oxidoreductase [bacterium]
MSQGSSRRDFVKAATVAGVGFWVAGGVSAKESTAAIEEVNLACVGVGGKGRSDSSDAARSGNIVAICDIDDKTIKAAQANPKMTGAKVYNDYRKMIDEVGKDIDAITVSTPDHNPAPAAIRAMREGIHAFTQKPMTHSIEEARLMGQIAAEKKLVTQMGNQGTANSALREAVAIIKSKKLGEIKEVHVWTNRPVWPQGIDRPKGEDAPANVHWDEWLGPVAERPYSSAYHPFKWRGFWAFGTGALGDMACHTLNMPFWGADLRDPVSVQATTSGHNQETYPAWSVIEYKFDATDARPAIPFTWYDGGKRPPGDMLRGEKARSGALVVMEKGSIYSGDDYCGKFTIWDADKPEVEFERSPGHFTEWINGIKAGDPSMPKSNFPGHAAPLTETVLLGNLAVWPANEEGQGPLVKWNAKDMTADNAEVAKIIRQDYREGWGIEG